MANPWVMVTMGGLVFCPSILWGQSGPRPCWPVLALAFPALGVGVLLVGSGLAGFMECSPQSTGILHGTQRWGCEQRLEQPCYHLQLTVGKAPGNPTDKDVTRPWDAKGPEALVWASSLRVQAQGFIVPSVLSSDRRMTSIPLWGRGPSGSGSGPTSASSQSCWCARCTAQRCVMASLWTP